MSARRQRCPGSSASTFPFRTPERVRSSGPRRFRSLLPLPAERGIRALQGVAACCREMVCEQHPSSTFVMPWSARAHTPADQKRTSASFRLRETLNSVASFSGWCRYDPARWWSERDSNPQPPDLKSGALPIGRSDVDVAWSEPIHGTVSAKPSPGDPPAAGQTTSTDAMLTQLDESGSRILLLKNGSLDKQLAGALGVGWLSF